MGQGFKTIIKSGTSEVIDRKSRFLGVAVSVAAEEEAQSFLDMIRKKHYDARHNCWAYVLGGDAANVRASDDGEPSGTAGRPILEAIRHAGLTDTLVVVTRYFGGTLLGTGGLVRAYTQAAEEALSDAETAQMVLSDRVMITTDYSDSGKLQYLFSQNDVRIEDSEYAEKVRFTLICAADQTTRLIKQITEATAGRAKIETEEAGYMNASYD